MRRYANDGKVYVAIKGCYRKVYFKCIEEVLALCSVYICSMNRFLLSLIILRDLEVCNINISPAHQSLPGS